MCQTPANSADNQEFTRQPVALQDPSGLLYLIIPGARGPSSCSRAEDSARLRDRRDDGFRISAKWIPHTDLMAGGQQVLIPSFAKNAKDGGYQPEDQKR